MDNELVKINNLYVEYVSNKGAFGQKEITYAVNGVNLVINEGEILAVAGESGCGKSTLAKAILQLEPAKSGEIIFEDENILNLSKSNLKEFKKRAQMVFQNPYSSLNPKMKIIDTLKEPLQINSKLSDKEIEEIVYQKIALVGIDKCCLNLYPHEFSGGQRQRIAIARALMLDPKFILADEPVSALDVSIQAQIINLLKELKEKYNLTFLLITHDLSVIEYLADRVAIMYLGEIVEIGCINEIFNSPKHPYTKALLSSIPQMKTSSEGKIILEGDLPSPNELPNGCKFNTRCAFATPKCHETSPCNCEISKTHQVRCFLYE